MASASRQISTVASHHARSGSFFGLRQRTLDDEERSDSSIHGNVRAKAQALKSAKTRRAHVSRAPSSNLGQRCSGAVDLALSRSSTSLSSHFRFLPRFPAVTSACNNHASIVAWHVRRRVEIPSSDAQNTAITLQCARQAVAAFFESRYVRSLPSLCTLISGVSTA